ncbi:MAG: hypothetical protein KAI79_06795 [Bacteroidales bacterium]|nr:hypothetical protein [Bacteroidales bacterium]
MKTLYIIPSTGSNKTFFLCDIQSGEVLASHICSFEGYAKGDLLNDRKDRIIRYAEKYNEEVEVKFFNEQRLLTEEEFTEKNNEWAIEEGIV